MSDNPWWDLFPYILTVHTVNGIAEGVQIYCRSKEEALDLRKELTLMRGVEAIYLHTHEEIWGKSDLNDD